MVCFQTNGLYTDRAGRPARGEYFSKNQYFFTTTKNGPARDSRDTLSLVSLDSNISARTQKKGNFSAHGSNISART